MDVAQRDQVKAHYAEWATTMRISYDALIAEGFTEPQALQLLAASFIQSSGQAQAGAITQMLDRLDAMFAREDD